MQQLIFLLFLTLSFTNVSFFKIGLVSFTVFNALFLVAFFVRYIYNRQIVKLRVTNIHLLITFYIVFVSFINSDDVKVSSFIYSLIILFNIIILTDISNKISSKMLLKIYKGILLVYFVNVFLTTLMIIAGLRPTGLIAAIFQYYDFANQVRPQGFASEPSYAAIIIVFSLLGILKITDFKIVKTNFKWYLMAIASIIMTQSSYGLIMIFIIVVYILNKEKKQLFKSKFFLGFVILLIPLGIYLLVYSNLNSITRLATIFQYVYDGNNISNSLVTLSEVDGSASFRVLPSIQMIEYYKTAPLSSILFGNGAGQASIFFSKFYSQFTEIETINLGFVPSFFYNYGLIGVALIFYFIIKYLAKEKLLYILLFILVLLNADFNSQLFVYVVFILFSLRRFDAPNLTLKLK